MVRSTHDKSSTPSGMLSPCPLDCCREMACTPESSCGARPPRVAPCVPAPAQRQVRPCTHRHTHTSSQHAPSLLPSLACLTVCSEACPASQAPPEAAPLCPSPPATSHSCVLSHARSAPTSAGTLAATQRGSSAERTFGSSLSACKHWELLMDALCLHLPAAAPAFRSAISILPAT